MLGWEAPAEHSALSNADFVRDILKGPFTIEVWTGRSDFLQDVTALAPQGHDGLVRRV